MFDFMELPDLWDKWAIKENKQVNTYLYIVTNCVRCYRENKQGSSHKGSWLYDYTLQLALMNIAAMNILTCVF